MTASPAPREEPTNVAPLPPFMITVERLLLAIRWIGWVSRYGGAAWPEDRVSPDGFGGREQSLAIVRRYDISTPVFDRLGFWDETLMLLAPNKSLYATKIDISGLIADLRENVHAEFLTGFESFLRAMACGELTQADMMSASTAV